MACVSITVSLPDCFEAGYKGCAGIGKGRIWRIALLSAAWKILCMTAKRLHRGIAIILVIFIISHLIVHLYALGGIDAHLKALDSVQWIYRNPIK